MTALEAERLDVGPERFGDPQAVDGQKRDERVLAVRCQVCGDEGWQRVLDEWLPRLLPGMGVALFHGVIRCAHATRAIETVDSPARRAELARSLGYWAGLFDQQVRPNASDVPNVDDIELAVIETASRAARRYLARPNIINLHGVTAAMAVAILVRHIDPEPGTDALAQLRAEHSALYDGTDPVSRVDAADVGYPLLVEAAVTSGEAHAVKLVEACLRGDAAIADPVFLATAERVARRGLKRLRNQEG